MTIFLNHKILHPSPRMSYVPLSYALSQHQSLIYYLNKQVLTLGSSSFSNCLVYASGYYALNAKQTGYSFGSPPAP